jgi:hypothetical protein
VAPPAMRTRPSESNVAVWNERLVAINGAAGRLEARTRKSRRMAGLPRPAASRSWSNSRPEPSRQAPCEPPSLAAIHLATPLVWGILNEKAAPTAQASPYSQIPTLGCTIEDVL